MASHNLNMANHLTPREHLTNGEMKNPVGVLALHLAVYAWPVTVSPTRFVNACALCAKNLFEFSTEYESSNHQLYLWINLWTYGNTHLSVNITVEKMQLLHLIENKFTFRPTSFLISSLHVLKDFCTHYSMNSGSLFGC